MNNSLAKQMKKSQHFCFASFIKRFQMQALGWPHLKKKKIILGWSPQMRLLDNFSHEK
jgi:hypothetical protein